MIIVAKTIIEEVLHYNYLDRPWWKGNKPETVVNRFLETEKTFSRIEDWSRRSLMGEFRDGILLKRGA